MPPTAADLPPFTRQDVVRWLGQGEVHKGAGLLDTVLRITVDGATVSARVQGPSLRPYEVNLYFTRQGQQHNLTALCSCPVGHGCMHCAAVLLRLLADRTAPAPTRGVAGTIPEPLRAMAAARLPQAASTLPVVDVSPVPVLELVHLPLSGFGRYRQYPYDARHLSLARPRFRYGSVVVNAWEETSLADLPEGGQVRLLRHGHEERGWMKRLTDLDFEVLPSHLLQHNNLPAHSLYALASEEAWPSFMAETLPKLRAAGFDVVIPNDFPHWVLEADALEATFDASQTDWLSLDLGIVVAGERVPLAPLLYALFQSDARFTQGKTLDAILDGERVLLRLEDGRRVGVPAARLKPIARTLMDLFDAPPGAIQRLPRLDAPRLDEWAQQDGWQFKGDQEVRALAKRLRQGDGVQATAAPAGLLMTLRPYQLEGLAWLQFLRAHALSGILADDMGLGKTAQTLAHVLLEKECGRLDRPALIVLPTSLIFNWKREIERFAPSLKLLSLHGKDRADRFTEIPRHDVVLTTYPLLWRDEASIAAHDYHLLILDEAQTVKNADSLAAQSVRKLRARHRLCLTGTPLENHLGELWAQFDFLLPGFLGDLRTFGQTWRNPIEKHGDGLRRSILARRIKPFILRRCKEEVAKELPPKTLITRTVEISGAQRDLYETVRAAMDQRIRSEIAGKGLARSHIVVLDALLKLRQVCCDPRLLKTSAASKKVPEHAKLDLLMDMLPELVAEGRRVLVFSQFTSMLDLIGEALTEADIPFVVLTGDTADRETVVRRFQEGGVPIFLISLKAGGVGLNLTAADTVIHFDPWWNPAAENQATDRAHRLGQDKRVFVYKLIVSGSIEEKILGLQEKKAALAAGILSDDASGLAKFTEEDIAALFAPLPGESTPSQQVKEVDAPPPPAGGKARGSSRK